MSTNSQFSWTRMEGIGLILTSLGLVLISQIPPTFFALTLIEFDLEVYFLTMVGVIVGTIILLTAISCSLTEDWDDSKSPTLKTVINFSLIITFLFILGFFIFFVLQPSFPPEMRNLDSNQRYLAAYTTGLSLIAILLVIFYKGRAFFNR
ncbi:hypothetical protein CEE45_06645 [Candidatus Heimdallarchaeota archaeon B3_Heim]|nr:MAG: hypothetical protein CEE45_06645 [Candidatus Heimdallarchaeota archaeon B3_Heim]